MIFLKTAILVIMTLACEIKSDPLVFWFQEHPFSPKRPLLPICLYRNDVEKILGITGFEEACGQNGSSICQPNHKTKIDQAGRFFSKIILLPTLTLKLKLRLTFPLKSWDHLVTTGTAHSLTQAILVRSPSNGGTKSAVAGIFCPSYFPQQTVKSSLAIPSASLALKRNVRAWKSMTFEVPALFTL